MPVYAPHTVVDQAVTAASRQRPGLVQGMLNACLRRFLRERATLQAAVADSPEAQWNHPGWWVKQLAVAYPQQWREILASANVPAPLTPAREPPARQPRAGAGRLPGGGAGGRGRGPVRRSAVHAQARGAVAGIRRGLVVGAGRRRLAAELLAPAGGMRVLDACSAPGGKTAHLLELADIELLALDADAGRLARVQQNLDRLGLAGSHVRLKAADAADLDSWWDGKPFHAVLADVPCTASGIVRRHPDIRWLRRENDVRRTATLQARILDALWRTVAPGGRLL